MSAEIYQIETRRRSRSKTPFLRSSCDHENCEHAGEEGHVHHKPKKPASVPTVQTIIEERVEVTSSSSSTPAASAPATKQSQTKTSDYSSDDLTPEEKQKHSNNRQQISTKSTATSSSSMQRSSGESATTSTKTTVVTKTKKFTGAGNTLSSSTPKPLASSYAAQFEQSRQHQSRSHEQQKRGSGSAAQQRQQKTSAAKRSAFVSSFENNGDLSDHIAYQEYVRAGEYWNATPKTDYTYSELSPHRRELAPGVVAMPNMSRRSLDNHRSRVNSMVARNPEQEEFIRRRYEANYAAQRQETERLLYDSGDEVDITRFSGNAAARHKQQGGHQLQQEHHQSWLVRILTTIVTTITSTWSNSAISSGYNAQQAAYYRTYYGRQQQQQRGILASIAHGVGTGIWSVFRYIYMFISSVLCLDTILLRSSNADNRSKKRFFILLLILLPLLLLAAWYLLTEDERVYYLQKSEALLPLTLVTSLRAGVGGGLSNVAASLKQLFQLPAFSIEQQQQSAADHEAMQLNLQKIEQNMSKLLTAEEYANILNHVNSYVQQLVDIKVHTKEAQSLTPAQTQLIVQLMRENLERVTRDRRDAQLDLNESDVAHIAEQVKLQLQVNSAWSPVRLTEENLNEIKRLITAELEVHNHAHYTLLVERIDLDALLTRILNSPHLLQFLDARIHAALDDRLTQLHEGSTQSQSQAAHEQERLIGELSNEIAFIKLALSDKHSENADLQQSISKLKLSQDDLLARMQQHELATDQRFSGLLAEIESKLSALNDTHFALLNKQIKLTLVEILGFKQMDGSGGNTKLDDVDLQNWVRSMFVAKEYLEERLMDLNQRTNNNIREEIERSSTLLMHDISERLKREILLAVEAKHNHSANTLKSEIRAALSEQEVRNIVKSVLAIYDADKTGLVDFALESAGGQILSTRCTESYQTKSAQISVFGIPLWYPTNTPRVAISPNVQPGECWAFQGFPGFLVLKLNTHVHVTGFTLEHIPKSLSPTGRIDSAPKNFTVWGLEHEKDQDPVLFGEYEYVDNGASLQYFAVQNRNIQRAYEIVELRIESNQGQPTYTCLYRFRVHGKPPGA